MQASETKLEQIIEGIKQYVVPLFQRPYSWTKTQWQALWSDLLELCTTDNPRPHFMGSIVTMPTVSVPEGVTKYLLIDGQQRLTTVFILLAVLRDIAKPSEPELAAELDNTFLVNPYKKGLDYYKLQPTQIDRESFHRIIHSQSQINGNGISECYLFFEKKIRQSRLDFQKIKQVICRHLSLVSVVLSTDDDPYLVFESLNAKGRPLNQADLIRNYFFMKIHADSQESVYAQYWQPMQDLLKDKLTEFIRHYLTKSGVEVKQNEIYFEIKERINKDDALSYLKSLSVFAEYYARLLNPEREVNAKARKYLQRLNRLEVATVYPFLLNCYDDWMQNRITEEEYISVLKIIENFILRRFVCNIQTRGLNRIFALLYSQVIKDISLGDDNFIGRLKLALQNRDYPKNTEFRARLMDVDLYTGDRSHKGKLILESIEESFNHKEQVSFEKLSIEHIMPQTTSDWWKEHLGKDWAVTHELLIDTLGNLTLTASEYNSAMSNSDFLTKRNLFQNSHLELNKYFDNEEYWCRENIEARAEYLADIALQIWSYFGNELAQSSQTSSLTGSRPKQLYIFGQKHSVKSWREVLTITLNVIANLEPEKFQDIMKKFPRFVGWDEQYFHESRKIDNGAFIEVNLSAKDIHTFCRKAIETAELSVEDWHVETTN
ncbi:DUF262 domain-containing protein [Calothrix sp. FACHB-1219]|uniref:DUF262 domain-containing protein n=1 Tax=unclassified Calothrix TaxID=2619626 RepID=UPI0016859293|nr:MULTISPECIES: DUF262 domain-containing protein [unclassified Calothrix]MBD2201473.1 DUF262 domain-containing protein [Calothrix sp. FACHB-168]MBD2215905.1 DUF262 domain-containing protein [Calothrix sp. FACHB-1219]